MVRSLALSVLFIVMALGLLGSCNNSRAPKIAILQDKPQEWADALKLGFTDGLMEQGVDVGNNVILVPRSATGDPQALSTIAESFVQGDYVLVYTLGTQSTQEIFNKTKTKPIIF